MVPPCQAVAQCPVLLFASFCWCQVAKALSTQGRTVHHPGERKLQGLGLTGRKRSQQSSCQLCIAPLVRMDCPACLIASEPSSSSMALWATSWSILHTEHKATCHQTQLRFSQQARDWSGCWGVHNSICTLLLSGYFKAGFSMTVTIL